MRVFTSHHIYIIIIMTKQENIKWTDIIIYKTDGGVVKPLTRLYACLRVFVSILADSYTSELIENSTCSHPLVFSTYAWQYFQFEGYVSLWRYVDSPIFSNSFGGRRNYVRFLQCPKRKERTAEVAERRRRWWRRSGSKNVALFLWSSL